MSADNLEDNLKDLHLKVRNYKGFSDDAFGFEQILPVNLIIGRNNTGKSTLLDLINYATSPSDITSLGHRGRTPQVTIENPITAEQIQAVYSLRGQASGRVSQVWSGDDLTFGQQWINARLTWALDANGQANLVDFDVPETFQAAGFPKSRLEIFVRPLMPSIKNPFSDYKFRRILSDRDITPEQEGKDLGIDANGSGFTSTVEKYLHDYGLPENLIERTILDALNKVFEPDGTFIDIGIQRHGDGSWEVYLEEEEKGRILLANTGSGIKTILLVLAFLYLVPHVEGKEPGEYLFGFEELENNLHPALQRRLLLYLRNFAWETGCRIFLTTHSNVSIDLFSEDEQAQILHVNHDGSQASVRAVTTYVHNRGILDDLDVRASDLLQANGVVWVEGPSDRIYFNRWVEIFSDDSLREGVHYQCVFYGGRLLAHLSADDPDVDEDEALKILRVNRHAVVIMDSDKERSNQPISSTKKRIVSEMDNVGGMSWVTKGREIENYLPAQAIAAHYGRSTAKAPTQFADFAAYLSRIKAGEGKRFERKKTLFAERVSRHITLDNARSMLDLEKRMSEAVRRIRKWNA